MDGIVEDIFLKEMTHFLHLFCIHFMIPNEFDEVINKSFWAVNPHLFTAQFFLFEILETPW